MDKNKSLTFVAMNSPMPACPHCGAIRLQDCGEVMNIMGGASDNTRNSDANFRRIADRYGLTDMNNKDGKAVRGAAAAPSSGQMVSVGGIQIPMEQAMRGECINKPEMAQKIPTASKDSARRPVSEKNRGLMKQMTKVVAEHKA